MEDNRFTEPTTDLLAQAKQQGYAVSREQLARWHRAGLLPRPIQKGRGRNRGSEVVYPQGAVRQLLALCALHQKNRRLRDNGWSLWWYGFTVEEKYSYDALKDAALWWDQTVHQLRDMAEPGEDDGDISEESLDIIEQAGDMRLVDPMARRMRKRVSSKNYPSLLRVALQMVIGAFDGRDVQRHNDQDINDQFILEKAMGISKARTDRMKGGEPWLKNDITPILVEVAHRAFDRPLVDILRETPREVVVDARNELAQLFHILDQVSLILERAYGKHAFGLGVIGDIARNSDPSQQAIMLLLWLALRQNPQMKEGMQALLKGIMNREIKPALAPEGH